MNISHTSPSGSDGNSAGNRFLWWLAAADPELIKDCGPDRFRYSVIGYTVLTTWIFATLAWGYFFSTLVDDILIILPAALFFGFVILTIDRSLIAGMNSNGSKNKIVPVGLRLLLAVTIGFFLSQPVVLLLFKKDVDAHLPVVNEKKKATFLAQVRQENAVPLQESRSETERVRNEQKAREQEILDLKNAYIRETDGTGGSGKIGESTIARVKKMAYLKAEEDLIVWKRENQAALDSSLARELRLNNTIQSRMSAFETGLSDGFLTRIETLDDLMTVHPPVKYRYRLVILLIMMIELMPLLTKLMMPSGLYEEKLRLATAGVRESWKKDEESVQHIEDRFYGMARREDEKLQDEIIEHLSEYRRKSAAELFEKWKRNPGTVRNFWEQVKKSFFFFGRN